MINRNSRSVYERSIRNIQWYPKTKVRIAPILSRIWQKEGETQISFSLHTQEEEKTLRQRCKVSEQEQNYAYKVMSFCIHFVFCSFKSRWIEMQEVALNLKKVMEHCKKKKNTLAVITTWHGSKFVRSFLGEHRTVRVLQQGEHANTCGLVVCHAKLIWLAGLNPGAKSNSALQNPEWDSRWGSQDDLPSYSYILLGVKGWIRHFLHLNCTPILLLSLFGCRWWYISILFFNISKLSRLYEWVIYSPRNMSMNLTSAMRTIKPSNILVAWHTLCSLVGFAATLQEWASFHWKIIFWTDRRDTFLNGCSHIKDRKQEKQNSKGKQKCGIC